MPVIMLGQDSRSFNSVGLANAVMELARQGVCGEVKTKKVFNGKVWAIEINGQWHINKLAEVKHSVRPGWVNLKKPWRETNARIAIVKRPKRWV